MTYPLSQTPGAVRQRTWRGRAAPREYYLTEHADPSRSKRPCGCCRKGLSADRAAADVVLGVLPQGMETVS